MRLLFSWLPFPMDLRRFNRPEDSFPYGPFVVEKDKEKEKSGKDGQK